MSILSLHPNQLRIIAALQSAMRILHATDHLTVVGGLGGFLGGKSRRVGDVDVLIDAALCQRYWDFLEILSTHGIRSVYDLFDRPNFQWSCCRPTIEHPLSLSIDCAANWQGLKHANLDILLKASDLNAIQGPTATNWIAGEIQNLKNLDDAAKANEIIYGHKRLTDSLIEGEEKAKTKSITPAFHDDLGLQYAC